VDVRSGRCEVKARRGIPLPTSDFIFSTSDFILQTSDFQRQFGEVAEWFKAAVLKTVEVERLPGVRIPSSPPAFEESVTSEV
jgi:hypothetical protein